METRIGPSFDSRGRITVNTELELVFISSFGIKLYLRNCSEKVDFQQTSVAEGPPQNQETTRETL